VSDFNHYLKYFDVKSYPTLSSTGLSSRCTLIPAICENDLSDYTKTNISVVRRW